MGVRVGFGEGSMFHNVGGFQHPVCHRKCLADEKYERYEIVMRFHHGLGGLWKGLESMAERINTASLELEIRIQCSKEVLFNRSKLRGVFILPIAE